MIGMGCASALVFSWGGNPGVGSLHRLRDAHRARLAAARCRSTSIATPGLTNRYVAGASGLPFAVMRGYVGTDLMRPLTDYIATVECPFTGEKLAAVRAIRPDVAVVHAQQADRKGNVQLWGITGVQKEAVLASSPVPCNSRRGRRRARAEARGRAAAVLGRDGCLTCVPGGARPSYSLGYYERDNDFYVAWDAISREREHVPGLDAGARAAAVPSSVAP